MVGVTSSLRRSRRSFALGTSALAYGLLLPVLAQAQCAPEPTTAGGTTTCTGTDTNGVRLTTSGATVAVAADAQVTNSGGPAVAVEISSDTTPLYATVSVAGAVAGGSQTGIALLTGTTSSYGNTTRLTLKVAEGGSVSGTTALTMSRSPGNLTSQLVTNIDNAGTISGTSGVALQGDLVSTQYGYTSAASGYGSIVNRATGVISGSIVGPVGSVNNAGLIDGGSNAAFTPGNAGTSYPYLVGTGSWTNSGTIRSNSAAATITSSTINGLTNTGTIANAGAGAALASSYLDIQNGAGAQISSGGSVAIISTGGIRLINAGTITGNVVTGNSSSVIDSTAGTINGSVQFGWGDDVLVVRYDVASGSVLTGITGSINAGAGTNTEQIKIGSDVTLNSTLTPISGFQRIMLDPSSGVTVTLGSGFSSKTALALSGVGTVANRGTIDTVGAALSDINYAFDSAASFRNEGSIRSSGYYSTTAIALQSTSFVNAGTITSDGGGIAVSYNTLDNRGSITAAATGVSMFDGVLTNSGSIVSTTGTGVYLNGSVGYTASNSGTIRGATAGATTSIYLTNTGTISSAGTGVQVQAYGYLINAAGGTVNGGTGGAVTVSSFNAGVANAGTINGDVTFSGYGTGNNLTYFALTGGTLNGNLRLGGGATLVTDLVNTGPGAFAGITGTVTADSNASLRYAVSKDATVTLASAVGPFNSVGYQVSNGATLTLTAAAGQTATKTVQLAGQGSVDLNANFAVTGTAAIQSTSALTYPGAASTTGGLAITSRGTIAATRAAGASSYTPVTGVSLNDSDSFTNLGTIALTDRNATANATAISGGASVTNAGTITLDGGTAISSAYGSTKIVNSGSITEIAGGAAATGISGYGYVLDNRGTISVSGIAAVANYNVQITNSGTIASTGGVAIGANGSSGVAQITNAAGGTITGTGGTAVRLSSGTFTNAGTVNGSIDMGYAYPYYSGAPSRSYASSIFVAAGGTVNGDLRFGDGDDLLLQTGDSLGVTGTVDGGAGTNIYGRSIERSGSVVLGASNLVNFRDALVQAVGTDTVATVTAADGFSGNVYVLGTGSVVNQATIAGSVTTSTPYNFTYLPGISARFPATDVLAELTNAGSIGGGVQGTMGAFTNTGTVSLSGGYGTTVSLQNDAALRFSNSGTISAAQTSYYYYQGAVSLSSASTVTAGNSGTINGGLFALVNGYAGSPVNVSLANSGTVSSTTLAPAVSIYAMNAPGGAAQVDNSGTIRAQNADADGGSATGLTLYTSNTAPAFGYTINNSGTIAAVTAAAAPDASYTTAAALVVNGDGVTGTITNTASGQIMAQGDRAFGVAVGGVALDLRNAGTISARGNAISYAIWGDALDDRVTNRGTIIGDILLEAGADTVDNAGTITGAVLLGDGDDRFVQSGGGAVRGVIDGGAGTNSFVVSGGTEAAPALFGDIRNFAQFTQTAGFARIGGTATLGAITLSGGRLVGQAGSVITAPQITVGQGATFGSAGIVNGNIAVAGTLSPGASPGTMTVNGNVALGSSSVSLFELSSGVSDRLVVNGNLSIASGATLQLVRVGNLRPGVAYTLLSASGGVTGSFTNVLQPSDPLGVVVLRGNRIDIVGTFRDAAGNTPQVSGSIAYLNATMAVQPGNSSLFNALSGLATADDASDPQAFARLTPEPYAAAVQMHVDNALALIDTARGPGFAASGDRPHAFTFGATLGRWHRLSGDAATGSAAARSRSYGFLGGLGFGDADWSIGAFGGYLNNRQYLDALGARTKADGAVAGVQARAGFAHGFTLGGSILYSNSQATTNRTLPSGAASGRYDLHSWVADATLARAFALAGGWAVRPQIGITYVRTIRDRVTETGGSPFALTVGRGRHVAGFGDGAVAFERSAESTAAFRPFVSFGVRYQLEGARADALASYAGGALALRGTGAARARLVGTASGGASYRLQHGVELFATATSQAGNDDNGESVSGGVRIRF